LTQKVVRLSMTQTWMSQERSIVLIRWWAMNREDRRKRGSPIRIIDTSLSLVIRGLFSSLFVLYISESTACKTSSTTWGWREYLIARKLATIPEQNGSCWSRFIIFFSYSILYHHPLIIESCVWHLLYLLYAISIIMFYLSSRLNDIIVDYENKHQENAYWYISF